MRAVCKINKIGKAEIALLNPNTSHYPLLFYTFEEQHNEGEWSYFDTLHAAKTEAEKRLCANLRKHYERTIAGIEWRDRLLHSEVKIKHFVPAWRALEDALNEMARKAALDFDTHCT